MPHRSVLDNIAMPLEFRGISKNDRIDVANKILSVVELQGWGNKYAHELSGGMQQRVGLARALAADPEFLLMDEPFSALDPLIRRQLQTEFIKLSKQMKKTTVFITHDLDEAVRVGHRIAIMRDGMVIQIGTPEEIVINPADEYVADFVKGISRLKVVQAKTIMQSIKDYENKFGTLGDDNELVDFVELTKNNDITVRFIELMPFDSHQIWRTGKFYSAEQIITDLKHRVTGLSTEKGSRTEKYIFRKNGYKGMIAVIPAYTRNICTDCNRIRITADGKMMNCLYSKNETNLRDAIRGGMNDYTIKNMIRDTMQKKFINGWVAQNQGIESRESMTQIGG